MRRVLPVLLLLAWPAGAAAPPVPSYARFGLVACDNTRRCEARGFDETSRVDLRVLRDAGDAPAEMTLTADAVFDPAKLDLDGLALALPPPAWRPGPDAASDTSNEPTAVHALLARLRTARRLALDSGGADGAPLDGLTAALLRVDLVQGRPGTSAPLLAPSGPEPVPGAPPVPSRPIWQMPQPLAKDRAASLIAATRKAAAAALAKEGCNRTDDDEAHALDAEHDLVLLGCGIYAYQASRLVYVVPHGGAATRFSAVMPTLHQVSLIATPGIRVLSRARHPPTREHTKARSPRRSREVRALLEVKMDSLTEGSFDPATGVLASSAKGRGPADCGVSAEWVWGSGSFRLVTLAYQEPCGGAAPGDWSMRYRTR